MSAPSIHSVGIDVWSHLVVRATKENLITSSSPVLSISKLARGAHQMFCHLQTSYLGQLLQFVWVLAVLLVRDYAHLVSWPDCDDDSNLPVHRRQVFMIGTVAWLQSLDM
jgi:hypothetical protein